MRTASKHLEIPEARLWHRQSAHVARRRSRGRAFPNVVGAEGFEPSNTGSKDPRLTAWPRPSDSPLAACQAAAGSPARHPVPEDGASGAARPEQPKPQVYTRPSAAGKHAGASCRATTDRDSVVVCSARTPRLTRAAWAPAATSASRNTPKTAEPLPGHRRMVGAQRRQARAPAGRLPGGGGRPAPRDRCAARRPRPASRESPGGRRAVAAGPAVEVEPAVGVGGRHAERRRDDDHRRRRRFGQRRHVVAPAGARARCRRPGRTARRRPAATRPAPGRRGRARDATAGSAPGASRRRRRCRRRDRPERGCA